MIRPGGPRVDPPSRISGQARRETVKLYFEHIGGGYWQLPGQQTKTASRVEVPTDSVGLCQWLNDRDVPLHAPQAPAERDSEALPTLTASNGSTGLKTALTASGVEEFILDHATVAEVERIFAALGTRFAEARKP